MPKQPPWSESSVIRAHIRQLFVLTLITRLCNLLLIVLSSYLPPFDSSSHLVSHNTWASTLLRWDAFHFAHIADRGYVFEYEWAFFPGTPLVMRLSGWFIRLFIPSDGWDSLLIGGALAALACDTTRLLYSLSLHHLGSPSLAFLASVLSLLSSSPATLRFASYSEPFFTYISYKGMLCCTERQWFTAAFYFMLASTFRSNGVILAGFILWGLVAQPVLEGKYMPFQRLVYAGTLTGIIFLPIVYHHYSAYVAFCIPPHSPRVSSGVPAWCSNFPPLIYAYVQSHYWNVGLFKYWAPHQIPNFVISAPPLAVLFVFSTWHIKNVFVPQLSIFLSHTSSQLKNTSSGEHELKSAEEHQCNPRFSNSSLSPHAIHALFLSCTLLFASHTQIVLRLAASMPILYWGAAWLLVEGIGKWGWLWVTWSVIWGAVSLVLWTTFLPPA